MPEILNVLIVDDEPEICLLLSVILKNKGFHTHTAHSIRDAQKTITQKKFQLAFLDLNLPDGVGYSLIPPLLDKGDNIKIIVISAYDGEFEKKKAVEEGADHFVSKPFTQENIFEALNSLGFVV